jgi:hypothetical protein
MALTSRLDPLSCMHLQDSGHCPRSAASCEAVAPWEKLERGKNGVKPSCDRLPPERQNLSTLEMLGVAVHFDITTSQNSI